MELKGKVKSFNAHKGWGFVECRGEDYFMHKKDLQGVCPAEGDQVQFTASYTKTGAVAKSVKVLFAQGEASFYGRIKTYNASKGFGFISSEAFPDQDVFVLWWGLPFGLGPPGSTCTFKVDTGEKGLVAKKVVLLGAAGRQIQQMQWMMGHGGFKGKDKTCWDMKTKGICKRAAAGKCRWEPCNAVKPEACTPITLNIYDVGQDHGVQWLNALFANYYSPLKMWGMFHVGVQVGQKEWAYGYTEEGSGVHWTQPMAQTRHHFSQSIVMPLTRFSKTEIEDLIQGLEAEWTGPSYDILERNCCHFADALCQRLEIGGIPPWTYRLANIASGAAEVLRWFDGAALRLS